MSLTQHPVSPRPPGVGNKRWEKTLMESISYQFISTTAHLPHPQLLLLPIEVILSSFRNFRSTDLSSAVGYTFESMDESTGSKDIRTL